MTKQINMLPGAAINGGTALGLMTSAGNPWSLSDGMADELVNRQVAVYADPSTSGAKSHAILASSGVLMMLPSSGNMGANGALTGLTALPTALGPCFMYFPAGAVYAGSAAGFYYATSNSTTTATVYDNRWTGGQPAFPSTPKPIVAAGPGAYVQTTGADITAASFTLPGGTLGLNGVLKVVPNLGCINNANNKSWKVFYGASTIIGRTNTTGSVDDTPVFMRNAGLATRQISTNFNGLSVGAGANFTRISVDSTADQTVTITLSLANAADYVFLQGYDAEVSF